MNSHIVHTIEEVQNAKLLCRNDDDLSGRFVQSFLEASPIFVPCLFRITEMTVLVDQHSEFILMQCPFIQILDGKSEKCLLKD